MKVPCSGLVLAGGLSSRMGRDKATLQRDEQTMLEFSQSLLASMGMEVFISGGEQGLPDLVPQSGPLGGIYTAINHGQSVNTAIGALLVVPVDMPLLSAPLLQKLVDAGETSGRAVCYQNCYLPLYLPVTDGLCEYLSHLFLDEPGVKGAHQSRSIKRMLATMGAMSLPVDNIQALVNVNTPEEWENVKKFINPSQK